jgi:hypothetical protein
MFVASVVMAICRYDECRAADSSVGVGWSHTGVGAAPPFSTSDVEIRVAGSDSVVSAHG